MIFSVPPGAVRVSSTLPSGIACPGPVHALEYVGHNDVWREHARCGVGVQTDMLILEEVNWM